MKYAPLLLLIFLMALTRGCDNPPQGKLPVTQMVIGNRTYTLEIAADPPRRQIGLMQRESMPENHGMIFIFPDEQPRSFWMKNTLIPLDILFLNTQGDIVSIGFMEPHTGRADSGAPARYAIELNAGQAKQAGVAPGDRLTLPEDILRMKVTR